MAEAYNKTVWTAAEDETIKTMVEKDAQTKAILEAVNAMRETPVSYATMRTHMIDIGALTPLMQAHKREHGTITQRMYDYLYVHRTWPLRFLTAAFNAEFSAHRTEAQIQQMLVVGKATLEHRMTEQEFRDEWFRLQMMLAPKGQVRRRHWLWRSGREDVRTTSSGCVYNEPTPPKHTHIDPQNPLL